MLLLKGLIAYFLLILASFFMVIGERLVTQRSFLWGRSICDYCHHPIHPLYLMPLIGPLLTKFHCSHCRHPIAKKYLFGELVYALSVIVLLLTTNHPIFNSAIFSMLFIMSVSDYHKQWVPDRLQLILLAIIMINHALLAIPIYWFQLIILLLLFILINKIWPQSIGGADIKTISLLSLTYPAHFGLMWLQIATSLALLYILCHNYVTHRSLEGIPFFPFITLSFPIISLVYYFNPNLF